uniref:Uncharacterized protein n=1 Tax=Schistosoma haematobium TaxID=6185 RepID=A0A095ALQ7_SCHHA
MTRDVCRLVSASFVYDSVKLSVVVVEVVSGHNASPLLLLVVLVPLLFISPTAESSDGLALGFGRLRNLNTLMTRLKVVGPSVKLGVPIYGFNNFRNGTGANR